MRIGASVDLRIHQPPGAGPELEVDLEPLVEHRADGSVFVQARDRLERGDVEQLREACEDFLEGRPLRP